jgi:hypothetical protein
LAQQSKAYHPLVQGRLAELDTDDADVELVEDIEAVEFSESPEPTRRTGRPPPPRFMTTPLACGVPAAVDGVVDGVDSSALPESIVASSSTNWASGLAP